MDALEIVKQATDPAVATDEESRLLDFNQAARELFGWRDGEAKGHSFYEAVEVRDVFGNPLRQTHLPFYEMAVQGEAIRNFEIGVRTASGRFVRLSVAVVVVLGPDPSTYRLVYLLNTVQRRRRADEAIERILANPTANGQSLFDRAPEESLVGGFKKLTPRQAEILRLLSSGMTNKDVAQALSISLNTVRTHVRRILAQLNAHSKTQAVALALRRRLI